MRRLGDLEAAVMDRLWSWGRGGTVREVLEDLNRDPRRGRDLAYTTVMTVMDNLHRKGVLVREPEGRAYRYIPVQDRAGHGAALIEGVLAGSDDRTTPLLRFVERLSPAEVARLRAALGGRDRGSGEAGDLARDASSRRRTRRAGALDE